MLKALRENFKGKPYLKVVLIVVAASLTLYLGAYFFERQDQAGGRPGAEWAIRVNGETVPLTFFQVAARNQAAYYRQLLGQDRDPRLITEEVLGFLIRSEIMRQEARKMGLDASQQEVSERILRDPSFHDANGNFIGKERYAEIVRRQFRSDLTAYETRIAAEIMAGKWQDLVTDPVTVSPAELEATYRHRTERTEFDYVLVLSQDQELDENVSDEELRRWYDENQESYRRPEGREVRMVIADRQAIQATVQISDDEVAASYQSNRAAYSHPDQRRARHILFRAEPGADEEFLTALRSQAEQVRGRLAGGEDFASLAQAMSQDPTTAKDGGDLGWFGRGQMVPAFESAVFETPVGELAPVVQTEFGLHVIEVTDAREAGVAPLEEVEAEIRRSLELRRAQELTEQQAARVAEAATSAAEFEAAAASEGLTVETRTVRRNHRLRDLGPSPEFLDTLFDLEVGAVSPPLGVARGMAVLVVDKRLEPSIAPFEQVKTNVKVDLLNQRLRDTALKRARQAIAGGRSLAAAAKSLGLEVKKSGDVVPGQRLPGTGGSTPEYLEALFGPATAAGDRGAVPIPAGAMIYEVTRRDPFDPEAFAEAGPSLEAELLQQRRSALLSSLLADLSSSYQVEIHPELTRMAAGS